MFIYAKVTDRWSFCNLWSFFAKILIQQTGLESTLIIKAWLMDTVICCTNAHSPIINAAIMLSLNCCSRIYKELSHLKINITECKLIRRSICRQYEIKFWILLLTRMSLFYAMIWSRMEELKFLRFWSNIYMLTCQFEDLHKNVH